MNNSKKFSLLIFTISILTFGCSEEKEYVYSPKTKLYPMRPSNSSDAAVIHKTKKLLDQNIEVITAGDGHLLVIPNALLFNDKAPSLTWQSYKILNQVIDYIKLYRTTTLSISAYVSEYGSKDRQQALSLARSTAVKDYLWTQNLDSRIIVSQGNASKKPIYFEDRNNLGDESKNSRIEIRFFEQIK